MAIDKDLNHRALEYFEENFSDRPDEHSINLSWSEIVEIYRDGWNDCLSASQNPETSEGALPISRVGESLPTDFADWMADNDIYKSIEGWEFEGGCYETDELYAEFLKSYPEWTSKR